MGRSGRRQDRRPPRQRSRSPYRSNNNHNNSSNGSRGYLDSNPNNRWASRNTNNNFQNNQNNNQNNYSNQFRNRNNSNNNNRFADNPRTSVNNTVPNGGFRNWRALPPGEIPTLSRNQEQQQSINSSNRASTSTNATTPTSGSWKSPEQIASTSREVATGRTQSLSNRDRSYSPRRLNSGERNQERKRSSRSRSRSRGVISQSPNHYKRRRSSSRSFSRERGRSRTRSRSKSRSRSRSWSRSRSRSSTRSRSRSRSRSRHSRRSSSGGSICTRVNGKSRAISKSRSRSRSKSRTPLSSVPITVVAAEQPLPIPSKDLEEQRRLDEVKKAWLAATDSDSSDEEEKVQFQLLGFKEEEILEIESDDDDDDDVIIVESNEAGAVVTAKKKITRIKQEKEDGEISSRVKSPVDTIASTSVSSSTVPTTQPDTHIGQVRLSVAPLSPLLQHSPIRARQSFSATPVPFCRSPTRVYDYHQHDQSLDPMSTFNTSINLTKELPEILNFPRPPPLLPYSLSPPTTTSTSDSYSSKSPTITSPDIDTFTELVEVASLEKDHEVEDPDCAHKGLNGKVTLPAEFLEPDLTSHSVVDSLNSRVESAALLPSDLDISIPTEDILPFDSPPLGPMKLAIPPPLESSSGMSFLEDSRLAVLFETSSTPPSPLQLNAPSVLPSTTSSTTPLLTPTPSVESSPGPSLRERVVKSLALREATAKKSPKRFYTNSKMTVTQPNPRASADTAGFFRFGYGAQSGPMGSGMMMGSFQNGYVPFGFGAPFGGMTTTNRFGGMGVGTPYWNRMNSNIGGSNQMMGSNLRQSVATAQEEVGVSQNGKKRRSSFEGTFESGLAGDSIIIWDSDEEETEDSIASSSARKKQRTPHLENNSVEEPVLDSHVSYEASSTNITAESLNYFTRLPSLAPARLLTPHTPATAAAIISSTTATTFISTSTSTSQSDNTSSFDVDIGEDASHLDDTTPVVQQTLPTPASPPPALAPAITPPTVPSTNIRSRLPSARISLARASRLRGKIS